MLSGAIQRLGGGPSGNSRRLLFFAGLSLAVLAFVLLLGLGLAAVSRTGTTAEVGVVTAARDIDTLRAAMRSGIVHYLIKPFRFSAFKEKLETYAALCERMGRLEEADQKDVDRLYSLLRTGSHQEDLPKGLSRPTLDLVEACLSNATRALTAEEVAQAAGISRVTARRYLDHLARAERAEVGMRYGSRGRPEHRYRSNAGKPS